MLFYPFIYDIYFSTFYYSLTRPEKIRFIGIGNYITLFNDPHFWVAARNTVLYVVTCLPLEFLLGLGIALLLTKDFKGISLFRLLFILPVLLPPIAITIMWRLMMFPGISIINYLLELIGIGRINWFAGGFPSYFAIILIDVWQWSPFIALILLAGLLGLPVEPYEAARVDGATPTQVFFYISLPLLKPVIFVALILRTLDLIKLFDPIYAIVTGGGCAMETLSVYIYKRGFKILDIGYGSAVSVIFWISAFVIANILVRRFKEYVV